MRDWTLPAATEARLQRFVALLLAWNRRVNLIARADEAFVWDRHVVDSAQLAPLLPPGTDRVVDLGSGAGFPGLVLAIVTDLPTDLVEADVRKAAFLRDAIRAVQVPARVHVGRAEAIRLPSVRAVTARALAPLPQLLELAFPFLSGDGVCLFPKGRSVERELTAARGGWHMRVERFPSRTSPDATLLRLGEIRRVEPAG